MNIQEIKNQIKERVASFKKLDLKKQMEDIKADVETKIATAIASAEARIAAGEEAGAVRKNAIIDGKIESINNKISGLQLIKNNLISK